MNRIDDHRREPAGTAWATTSSPNLVDDRVALLIEAGAATAANGETILREAVRDLRAARVPEDRIRGAIEIGQIVRAKPAGIMREAADVLTGTHLVKSSSPSGCPAAKLEPGAVLNVAMLIASGAAMGANCEPCLEKAVLALVEGGVSEVDIRRAVEIGQAVKDRAGRIAARVAEAEMSSSTTESGPVRRSA